MSLSVRTTVVTVSMLLAIGAAGTAHAQEAGKPAATAHCGGLLCDAYYAGIPEGQPSPSSLPCRDFVCGFFGGRTPEQPVAAAEPASTAPETAPAKPVKVRKKRVAKAVPKSAETAPKPVEAATK